MMILGSKAYDNYNGKIGEIDENNWFGYDCKR